jgi:2-keto-4-pentenoate hydratase/2-oxohepta-3-ene-1,7-dioic acid hydratase in catechol pathway
MKIVVFGPEKRVGAWVGDNILDLNMADGHIPFPLLEFIEAGSNALDRAQRVIDQAKHLPDPVIQQASRVKIHAPWPGRRACMAGANFASHVFGMDVGAGAANVEDVVKRIRRLGIRGFWKVPVHAAGPDEEVAKPKRTKYMDYEGEAVIVLGKRVKDFRVADIASAVWGVTLTNDLCTRDEGGNPGSRFAFAKNFDGSFTLGPCIVVGEGIDFQDLPVQTRVNGELRQDFSSKDMVFSFGEMLEFATRDFTFYPGDLISGGTGSGTAADSTPKGADGVKSTERFLKPGDVVEVSSPAIGILRNRIV